VSCRSDRLPMEQPWRKNNQMQPSRQRRLSYPKAFRFQCGLVGPADLSRYADGTSGSGYHHVNRGSSCR
jgi:hypothetical protein